MVAAAVAAHVQLHGRQAGQGGTAVDPYDLTLLLGVGSCLLGHAVAACVLSARNNTCGMRPKPLQWLVWLAVANLLKRVKRL